MIFRNLPRGEELEEDGLAVGQLVVIVRSEAGNTSVGGRSESEEGKGQLHLFWWLELIKCKYCDEMNLMTIGEVHIRQCRTLPYYSSFFVLSRSLESNRASGLWPA